MTQVTIAVNGSQAEIEKQINNFFKANKNTVKYVDIKYIVQVDGTTYAMIIYDVLENNNESLKL